MNTLLKIPASPFDHHRGNLEAPVVLLQYGDYQCPYSSVIARDVDRLLQEYGQTLCHVYRHFPQHHIHEYSVLGAIASEVAAKFGKFWEFHAAIFEHSEALGPEVIQGMFREILGLEEVPEDLDNRALLDKVQEQYLGAQETGVTTTPAIFINNILYQGPSSYWPLKEAIELELGNFRSATF